MKTMKVGVEDAGASTAIAFAAKRHWSYPDDWIQRWRAALMITPEYLARHPAFVAIVEAEFVGFWAVQVEAGDALLAHYGYCLPSWTGAWGARVTSARRRGRARKRRQADADCRRPARGAFRCSHGRDALRPRTGGHGWNKAVLPLLKKTA